jgi:hypothetical protein
MGRSLNRTTWIALLAVLATVILLRNLALDSPLMAGDEYAYFAAAQTFPDTAARYDRDPSLPRIYSPVFAAYGRTLALVSPRPELLMKALNTLCFALTALLFLNLVARLGGRSPSPPTVAVFLMLPMSAYSAYFMPETTYALLFAVLTWLMLALLPANIAVGSALSGVVVGTMLLIKPHALSLFLAVLATLAALAVAPRYIRRHRRTLLAGAALFAAATYITVVGLNAALTHRLRLDPLLFVGDLYRGFLVQGSSLSSWLGRVRLLAGIFAGHLVVLVALLAPVLALAGWRLRDIYLAQPDSALETRRLKSHFVLISLAAFAALFAIGMTTNFTGQISLISAVERLRLHGRYYSFVFPICLTVYFVVAESASPGSERWIRWGALAGCVAAALLYYLQGKRIIYPFDYPEAYVFSAWHGETREGPAVLVATYAGIVVSIAAYAVIVWRAGMARFVYPALLLALFALGNVGITVWQRGVSAGSAMLRADGRAMKQIIAAGELDQGLVVGSEWNGPLANFMFNFGSSARVIVRPAGSVLSETDIPAGTQWVVLTDRYHSTFAGTALVRTPRVTLIRVAKDSPDVATQ